ncbi:hypothetical protein WMQ30_22240 [Vibrio diabolicus]|uniref:hypothetical protein n=1 Tax=Vibrio diabolicus TaxID=50719 RepID=UPI003753CCEA
MNSEDFNKCREFLEKMIMENPENQEFLSAYTNLVNLKSEHDKDIERAILEKEIKDSEFYYVHRSTVHTNNTNYDKSKYENDTKYDIERSRAHSSDYEQEHKSFRSLPVEERGQLFNSRGSGRRR